MRVRIAASNGMTSKQALDTSKSSDGIQLDHGYSHCCRTKQITWNACRIN